MTDDPRLAHEIRQQALRAGVDIEGLCPVEILVQWADRDVHREYAREHALERGQELEAENRLLRERVRIRK